MQKVCAAMNWEDFVLQNSTKQKKQKNKEDPSDSAQRRIEKKEERYNNQLTPAYATNVKVS